VWARLLLAGIGFRLIQFFTARSLWLDESMLGLNIASRSLGELLRPLDYNQVAPPLFLWLGRLSIRLAGRTRWPCAPGPCWPGSSFRRCSPSSPTAGWARPAA
jgi:hypothetical protein